MNSFYQKLKYDKEYLISVSNKEILKHEANYYEKQIKERSVSSFDNSLNLQIDKYYFHHSALEYSY